MSNLNPIQIDRYVLYLDNLVLIKLDATNANFYILYFSNGETMQLAQSLKDQLTALLPPSFLPYADMWVNDSFVHYLDLSVDLENQSHVITTKMHGIDFEIKEYGLEADLSALITSRIALSSNASINTTNEVSGIVATSITDRVAPVAIQLNNLGDYFNNLLTA